MKEEQRELYSLIINQLVYDGFINEATKLSESTMIPCPIKGEASNRLHSFVHSTSSANSGNSSSVGGGGGSVGGKSTDADDDSMLVEDILGNDKIKGVDFDNDNIVPGQKMNVSFLTKFITTHKNACRCAKFSWDGKFVATGSSDTSIKLLDVNKMRNYNQTKNETSEDFAPSRPVIRTFYDHTQPINDLDFHPSASILSSASKDGTIRFYDYKSSVKRSFKFIQDSHSVRSINFHPCGDMLLAGTDHPMIRLYNVNTFQTYTARKINEHHHGPINQLRFSLDGSIFASCSKDATIKIWDSNNFSLITTLSNPHSGEEPTHVQISRNQKYLLSCGRDSYVKLWEISSGRVVQSFNTGVSKTNPHKNRIAATFNYTEDFIITNDEQASSCVVYNTRTGEQLQVLSGHNQPVRGIAASPVENALMTCSLDHRGRFWTEDTATINQQQQTL
ncbi:hypothetical protein CYY_001842 [Polysphondylium violaceum]|uniref:Cleavage stimulation factor 50 kDa subunit n=1 Tax=Polysphondylium violaceum TaxID=133409 RepID=A0A8J4V1A3_9MYCE|nr:hypothetical protein CYY_001842 [Polysphondylium violaceum]